MRKPIMKFYIHQINLKNNQVQLQEQHHLNLPKVAKSRPENGPKWGMGTRATKLNKTQKMLI